MSTNIPNIEIRFPCADLQTRQSQNEQNSIIKDNKVILSCTVPTSQDLYLQEVALQLNDIILTDSNQEINVIGEKEQEIKVCIVNSEDRMAKQIEVGFCFPYDFMLAPSSAYTIFKAEAEQILRYNTKYIHGNTNQIELPIKLTALRKGEFEINTFIKAENIKSIYRKFTIIVE